MKKFSRYLSVFISLALCAAPLSAKKIFEDADNNSGLVRSYEAGLAEEEFRRGVQSYYRGMFNDAIMQFERALSYLPNENLIIDWLGKAYYKAGMEGAALKQWEYARENGYGGLLLDNRIEVVRERRVAPAFRPEAERYTEAGAFAGIYSGNMIFSQPVSALPEPDGSLWVLAYGSNELLKFDINGNVIHRVTGPLVGFDRPVDIIRNYDGTLLVSESAGDRIAVLDSNGFFKKYIGKKGRGTGEFVSPQCMALDSNGNLYVTDYGNSRVSVFDKDGNGIYSFGRKTDGFDGLKGPTGIAIIDDRVFVGDNVKGCIYEFDTSGNYKDLLVNENTFSFLESIKVCGQFLLVSDKKRVTSVDLDGGITYENVYAGNGPSRITCAVPDSNGNIIVTDLLTNEVYIMTKIPELLGGLFVQIERVNASAFPKVVMEVSVSDRHRKPVVGLKASNFYITEQKRPVSGLRLEGSSCENRTQDMVIIIDRSSAMNGLEEQLETAVKEIAAGMEGVGNITVISSGAIPVVEYKGSPSGLLKFSTKALKTKTGSANAFDLSCRLAVNELINAQLKRSIVYIGNSSFADSSFTKYSISDLTAYLNNNRVTFSTVLLKMQAPGEELDFMTKVTNGKDYYVYRPQGLKQIVTDLLDVPSGIYTFSFNSVLPTDLGRNYLNVEVESYIMNRSGRDETGYFAPLQ